MALKNLKIQLPDTCNVITVNVEETTMIGNLVDTLKDEGHLDGNSYYMVKTINNSFLPPGVEVQKCGEDELVIIRSSVPIPDFGGDLPKNTQQRCQLLLVLDTSGSMTGPPIAELNNGLQILAQQIKSDPVARQRVEIAIIEFNSTTTVVQQPALIDDFNMPALRTTGTTKLVEAVRTAINYVESRKQWHRNNGLSFNRPHIVLITDGEPDSDQDMIGLSQEIKTAASRKKFAFLPVGVQGANHSTLKQIAQDEFPPLPLYGFHFDLFFKWLSTSISAVSKSRPEEKIDYANPQEWISKTGWGSPANN